MIGTDHNLTLPSTSETMAENIARIATALETLEDSVAERATPAALDINAALDMQGNSLTDVASVVFASGNYSSTVGSIFYFEGNWYVVDAVGAIQLTSSGQLNAASVGGIGGDYGGVNPAAVTYVDSDGQYVFTEDTGVYADLRADDLILEGDNGRVQINVDAAITGDRELNIKTLNASGVSMLVYNASTSTLEEGATTRATGTQLFTNVNITAADVSHGDVDLPLSFLGQSQFAVGGSATLRPHDANRIVGTDTWTFRQHIPLKVGDRVKSATVQLNKTGTATAHIRIYKSDGTTLTQMATNSTASGSTVEVTATVGAPAAIATGEHWYVEIEWPGSDGTGMRRLRATYDRPS